MNNLHQLLQRLQLEEFTLSDELLRVTLLEKSSNNVGEKEQPFKTLTTIKTLAGVPNTGVLIR